MTRFFPTSAHYFDEVAQSTSEHLSWSFLKIYQAVEQSNDVKFENSTKHTLTLELTGTRQHLTQMDGIFEERPTLPGEICGIPAGLAARFAWQVDGVRQRSTMVEFDQDLFKHYCPEIASDSFLSGHLLPYNYSANPALASLIGVLSRELEQPHARGILFAETAIRLLAMEVAATQWSRLPDPLRPGGAPDPRIQHAIEYIAVNFRANISLLKLCEVSGLSATRLIGLFRQATGKTPYSYVVSQRMEQAAYLLKNTDLPICHIALDAGFSDQQHMTHQFRRHGLPTPKSFRHSRESAQNSGAYLRSGRTGEAV